MNDIKYTIWCTYHNRSLLNQYNLYDSKNFKLFYNDNFDLIEPNINYLHDYIGDMATYYYVWKNNIKSDYVGFCQYKRHFQYFDINKLNKYQYIAQFGTGMDVTLYEQMGELVNKSSYIMNSFIIYMKYKYNIDIIPMLHTHNNYMSWNSIYMFSWDAFDDACDFIFGFLNYLLPNEGWKDVNNITILSKLIHYYNNSDDYLNEQRNNDLYWGQWKRLLSVLYEFLLGTYLSVKYGYTISTQEKYVLICNNIIDDYNELMKWFNYNIKSGILSFIVKSNNITIGKDELKDKYNLYQHHIYITKPNSDIKYNKNLIPIYINSNERILCDSSIEFNLGNYSIEKF